MQKFSLKKIIRVVGRAIDAHGELSCVPKRQRRVARHKCRLLNTDFAPPLPAPRTRTLALNRTPSTDRSLQSAPTALVDGEAQQSGNVANDELSAQSPENRLVILKKPPVVADLNGERGDDLGDVTLKELQGRLAAAAAAAIAAQQQRDLEQRGAPAAPQPAPSQIGGTPQTIDEVFKSLEQLAPEERPSQPAAAASSSPAASPTSQQPSHDAAAAADEHVELPLTSIQRQQPVEPAPIALERADETSEQVQNSTGRRSTKTRVCVLKTNCKTFLARMMTIQKQKKTRVYLQVVDFPAVKFSPHDAPPSAPMHDVGDSGAIFFQVLSFVLAAVGS